MLQLLEHLWRLGKPGSPLPVLLLGAAGMFIVELGRPIWDVDIFWQLRLGELTLDSGLPHYEPFLAGKECEPYTPVAWLGQVIYALVRRIGGWHLLHVVDAAIWFGGLLIVARYFARRVNNDWPALTALWIGWYAAIPFASLRPQSWALLAFGLLIVLVHCAWSSRAKLLAGAVLLILWQNLHPSVIFGVGYLGAAVVGSWVARSARIETMTLIALLLVSVMAMFLTPAGTDIIRVSNYNTEISRDRGITEWFPMWHFGGFDWGRDHAWTGFALAVTLLGVCFFRRRWPAPVDILAFAGLTLATLLIHRFVIFWALTVIPVGVAALTFPSTAEARSRWRAPMIGLVIFGVAVMAVACPPRFIDYFCFPARDALKSSRFRGTIYCNYFWGGVLIDAGYPEWKVTHDGRYYLFRHDDWRLYDATEAGQVPLDQVLARWQPDAFFLRKPHDNGMVAQLRDKWLILHEDATSIVFRKP